MLSHTFTLKFGASSLTGIWSQQALLFGRGQKKSESTFLPSVPRFPKSIAFGGFPDVARLSFW